MRSFRLLALMGVVLLLNGCMSMKWEPSWSEARPATPSQESERLMAVARLKFNAASDQVKLLDSILAYHKVLEKDPGNYEALTYLGNQYILLGTAYTENRSEKRKYFALARKYCELALYTNPDFKKAVDSGKKPWEAADTLTEREVHAILFWVTAVQYDFKEGMLLPWKIANVHWMNYALPLLDRVEQVAPDFGGGSVEFAKTICYFALPKSQGGDKELGRQYMLAAMKKRDDWMFGRWARGKYYNKVMKDKVGVQKDLKWVATRNLSNYKDPYPWRVHFRDDAQRLLK